MDRPLADKRPLGPFAQMGDLKTVLVVTDFTVTGEEQELEEVARVAGNRHLSGEVADVRKEDHAISIGDRVEPGIRVVYDAKINAIEKNNIDNYVDAVERELQERDMEAQLGKVVISAGRR